MGRHRRSAAYRAATGRATGVTETYSSHRSGFDPQDSYQFAPQDSYDFASVGTTTYLSQEPDPYARSDAYLFASEEEYALYRGEGYTPADGPRRGGSHHAAQEEPRDTGQDRSARGLRGRRDRHGRGRHRCGARPGQLQDRWQQQHRRRCAGRRVAHQLARRAGRHLGQRRREPRGRQLHEPRRRALRLPMAGPVHLDGRADREADGEEARGHHTEQEAEAESSAEGEGAA